MFFIFFPRIASDLFLTSQKCSNLVKYNSSKEFWHLAKSIFGRYTSSPFPPFPWYSWYFPYHINLYVWTVLRQGPCPSLYVLPYTGVCISHGGVKRSFNSYSCLGLDRIKCYFVSWTPLLFLNVFCHLNSTAALLSLIFVDYHSFYDFCCTIWNSLPLCVSPYLNMIM